MTRKILKSRKKSKGSSKLKGPLGLRLVKVISVNQDKDKFHFRLRFDDGVTATVDLSSVFEMPRNLAAEVLKGNMLRQWFIDNGGLAWPNGLELCADKLRMIAKDGKRAT